MAKIATDFDKIIQAGTGLLTIPGIGTEPSGLTGSSGRERKRNETLAAKIFSKDHRRSSLPPKAGSGGSLASRVGVQKVRQTPTLPRLQDRDSSLTRISARASRAQCEGRREQRMDT